MGIHGIDNATQARALGKKIGIALQPSGNNASPRHIALNHGFVMFRQAADNQAAVDFLALLAEKESMESWSEISGLIPPVSDAIIGWREVFESEFLRTDLYIKAVETSRGTPYFPRFWDARTQIQEALPGIMAGEVAARTALTDVSRRIDNLLMTK